MTAPYFPSQGWKPRRPATDVLSQTLGGRFGASQPSEATTPPPSPPPSASPRQAIQAPQNPQTPPGSTPGPVQPNTPVNPFRPAAQVAVTPDNPPPTTPSTTPPSSPPNTPPAVPAAPATPASAGGWNPASGTSNLAGVTDPRHPMSAGGSWNTWLQSAHPNLARFLGGVTAQDFRGDPNSAAVKIHGLLESYAGSGQAGTPGTVQWWDNLENWANSEDTQNQVAALLASDQQARPDAYATSGGVQVPEGPDTGGGNTPQNYSMFGNDPELDALVKQGLVQPSRFNNDLVTSMWNSRAGDIDNQYDQSNRDLTANLSSRGIRDSTFGGEKQQALAGQRRTAKSSAAQSLAEDIANTMSQDRSRAISDAMSLRGQKIGQQQFDQNYQLARRFGESDRDFRERQQAFNEQYQTETFNAGRQDSSDALYRWLVSQGLV